MNVLYVNNLESSFIMSLRTTTGTYNVNQYPWAYQAWKRQQQIHWIGEEVPLGEDVKDWQGEALSSADRNLLTQIFRFFTQSDIEVADNYFKRFIPIFKPLEIQMMMAAFTNMETVHIDAYALLLQTIGMPETEFNAFRSYESMRAKVDYMHTFGVSTDADIARTVAMFGAFTEGMSLFASFAMLMNFPRHNKMKGMGQIVTWSIRDESLHCESMIKLYHEWNKETRAVTKEVADDITEVGRTMVGLEDKFIELAFGLGDATGMTAENVKAYIRYIADWRLTQLHLTPIYGYFTGSAGEYTQRKEHPLPWLTAMLNGVEHANFFEARATEYSKGTTTGDWPSTWKTFDRRQLDHVSFT